jgi:hypothetical protein
MPRNVVAVCLRWLLPAGLLALALAAAGPAWSLDFPGRDPGAAEAKRESRRIALQNALISVAWDVAGTLRLAEIVDRTTGATLSAAPAAEIEVRATDGSTGKWPLGLVVSPVVERIAGEARSASVAGRRAGYRIRATLASRDGRLQARWQAILRDGSNYVRVWLDLEPQGAGLPDGEIRALEVADVEGRTEGIVDGAPVVAGDFFLACEHPMAANTGGREGIACRVGSFGPLVPGRPCRRSWVIGVAPPGQMRRAFACYLERERPRSYRPLLHYNSWYDLAWVDRKMDEAQCVAVIRQLGRHLVEERGVTVDSYVFDDGWDDNRTLWRFHAGFPRGFTPLDAAARDYHGAVGVWLSPWGGYAAAREERLKYGRSQGFETNSRGFALAGTRYYGRFREVCAEMIRKYHVNYFKFDGIAQGIAAKGAGAALAGDVEALLRLLADLREIRPDLFLNVTTGTWPSPFWLLWADSTWRNGDDMGFFGAGSKRQQWITYRDMIAYQWIVRRSPLYPLNSLMTQGIAQARLGTAAELGNDLGQWKAEVRSFFASGTQLQELYVTPQMLTPPMWDALAEAALWARRRTESLVDVHWVGGDPGHGEPYAMASWSPSIATLSLRNPADKPATMTIDLAQAFQLPAGARQEYRLASPWQDTSRAPLVLRAGEPHRFTLAPLEVLVFDATPVR